jgi:hypothetical protein
MNSSSVEMLPLPPGMTIPQYFALQKEIATLGITVSVAVALAVWDYLSLLGDEIILYRKMDKKSWTSPGVICFIVLRYAGLLAFLPSLWFSAIPATNCPLVGNLSQAGVVLVTASAGLIFGYRAVAIWHGNRDVMVLVGIFYVLMVGCWIADATRFELIAGPVPPFGTNCQPKPIPDWSPLSYASSVAFDSLILILGLAKLRQNTTTSRATSQLYKDNIRYFIMATTGNLTVLIIQALPQSLNFVKSNAIPYATLMVYAMGSRVFLNLRLINERPDSNGTDRRILSHTLNPGSPPATANSLTFTETPLKVIVDHQQHSIADDPENTKFPRQYNIQHGFRDE